MEDPETMIGPVAEALGVTRTWLLSSDDPLPDHIDLPVSLMVELMDAADALYPTEEQRWRQLRGWLSRLTGRAVSEFDRAAPLMEAVRRQFMLSRDEDLQSVSVWKRAQPPAAELSRLQLTVRPENGARLRRLVQQLGSEEAAIEFLLQMDDNCGKGAALRRTRWPPKVHYESSRGQVKIDVGTEMVCVVLSQFKPAPAPEPEPENLPAPAPPPPPPPHSNVEVVSAAPEVLVVNGHAAGGDAPHTAGGAAPPLPLGSSSSAYQTVVRDATLPAQMFADDDLAADQLSEVQSQLTSVLDQLAEDSNQMGDMPQSVTGVEGGDMMAAEGKVVAEEHVVTEAEVGMGHAGVGGEDMTGLGDTHVTLGGEEVTLEGEVSLEEQGLALDSEEVIEGEDVTLEGEEVPLEGEEVPLEGEVVLDEEVALDGQEVALDADEVPLDSEDMSADACGAGIDDNTTTSSDQVSLPAEPPCTEADLTAPEPDQLTDVTTEITDVTDATDIPEQAGESLQADEPLVELPEQLMESEEPSTADDEGGDDDQIQDVTATAGDDVEEEAGQGDEPMVEQPDEPMDIGGEAEAGTSQEPPAA